MNDVRVFIDIAGAITLVVGAILVVKSQTTRETIRQQAELIAAQKDRLDLLESQHIQNAKAIGELQGQLAVYREVPLKDISKSLAAISKTQHKIVEILKERE